MISRCIYCKKNIDKFCSSCKNQILMLGESLPIVVDTPHILISSSLKFYRNEISRYKNLLNKIAFKNEISYKEMEKGLLINLSNFREMENEMTRLLGVDFPDFPDQETEVIEIDYLNSIEYLKRDWAYTKEGEKEIRCILSALKALLSSISIEKNKEDVLVLGAGTCRLAAELANLTYNKIIAVDISLTMAFWFNKLKHDAVSFAKFNLRNNLLTHKKTVLYKAYINKRLSKLYSKVTYLIADALNLPFREDSFSLVFSVYFTDVVILKNLIVQVSKILKKGGYFIHFGPLNYHFRNILEMLSAEEIIETFKFSGYTLVYSDNVQTSLFMDESSLKKVSYNNLVYAFQKKF